MKRIPVSVPASIAALVLLLYGVSHAHSQTISAVSNSDAQLGRTLYREGKYVEALLSFKKAVKVNAKDGDAWYYLGATSLQLKDFKNASKAFERACKLQPNSVRPRSGLALSLLQRNQLKDAFQEARRAVALDAAYPEAHVVLGVWHLQMGDRVKALDEADRAITLNQNYAEAYLLRSQALVQFTSGALVPPELETPEDHANSLQSAADSLEKFLQLTLPSVERLRWNEQLAGLKFHLAMRSRKTREENDVYNSKQVTTKVKLTSKPEPEYTELASSNNVVGTVILRALLAADGTVKHIIVVQGLPDGLTWEAVRAAQRIKFVPATLEGRSVGVLMQLEYNFNGTRVLR